MVVFSVAVEHHMGTDPVSEMFVLREILGREALLSRLEVLCEDLIRKAHRAWALREMPPPLDGDGGQSEDVLETGPAFVDPTVTVAHCPQNIDPTETN